MAALSLTGAARVSFCVGRQSQQRSDVHESWVVRAPSMGRTQAPWQRLRTSFFARPLAEVRRPVDSSAGRRPRTPSARLRAARVAAEAKTPPLQARSPAYDSIRRLSRRTRPNPTPDGPAAAKPRRAVLLGPTGTKKAARPAPQGPTATAAAPHNAHVYTQAPRPRPQGLPSP